MTAHQDVDANQGRAVKVTLAWRPPHPGRPSWRPWTGSGRPDLVAVRHVRLTVMCRGRAEILWPWVTLSTTW
jgi:hypothetical protein